jgi:CoA:oxalate CoA-transferase
LRLKETPGRVRLPAPEFGQHTEEILTELLGYSWEQIGVLKDQAVI